MGETPEARAALKGVRAAVDGLLACLLAPSCAACGLPLDQPTRGPVCGACWLGVRLLTPPFCRLCGDALPTWRLLSQADGRCPRCRRRTSALDVCRAAGPYEGTLREIVHALKYNGRHTLARPLGALLRLRAPELLADADLVVPVPLHPARRRERGFNQALLLARELGVPVLPALRRTRRTASQTALPAARRHRNVRGAFALARRVRILRDGRMLRFALEDYGSALRNRRVVLVDDVTTTGATLEACAAVLKTAGAREVRALTVARAAPPARR